MQEDLFFSQVNIVKQISPPLPHWHFQQFSQQLLFSPSPSPSIHSNLSLSCSFHLHLCAVASGSTSTDILLERRRTAVSSPQVCLQLPAAGGSIVNGRQLISPQSERKGHFTLHFICMCSGKLPQLASTRIKIQSTRPSIT